MLVDHAGDQVEQFLESGLGHETPAVDEEARYAVDAAATLENRRVQRIGGDAR